MTTNLEIISHTHSQKNSTFDDSNTAINDTATSVILPWQGRQPYLHFWSKLSWPYQACLQRLLHLMVQSTCLWCPWLRYNGEGHLAISALQLYQNQGRQQYMYSYCGLPWFAMQILRSALAYTQFAVF